MGGIGSGTGCDIQVYDSGVVDESLCCSGNTYPSYSTVEDNSAILAGIRRAAFVIADVTEPSANVFYEIGFAEGMGEASDPQRTDG